MEAFIGVSEVHPETSLGLRGGMPHGRPALRAADEMLMRIVNEIDYGILCVDAAGRLVFANHAALIDCAQPDGILFMPDGHVTPRLTRFRAAYAKALQACASGKRTLLSLAGHGDGADGPAGQSLAVLPIGGARGEGQGDAGQGGADGEQAPAAVVLLVLGKRQVCAPLSTDFFARSHGLTLAETTVLKRLGDGARPAVIATELSVAISTVRSHISSIRHKTQSPSIADLLRKLTVLPPILSALNRSSLAMSVAAH